MEGHKSLLRTSISGLDFAASVVSAAYARTPRTSSALPTRTSDAIGDALPQRENDSVSTAQGRPSFPLTLALIGTDENATINPKVLVGLYCNYALIGIINGCLLHTMTKPICLYVFDGIANDKVTYAQCNMGAALFQMPWNFKVFYAFLVDRVNLFGSRRYWWIVGGWSIAICMLGVVTAFVGTLADKGDFRTYVFLMMATCFFYMFADVAADGLTVEFSQLEPPETRGYILSTGQMVRFGFTGLVLFLNLILTNGPQMYPPGMSSSTLFPFGLNIWQLHLMLLLLSVPALVVMAICLQDAPPVQSHIGGLREGLSNMWLTLQSKAMLMMIIFNIGFIAIAGLGNPAAAAISSIVVPTPLMLSASGLLGQMLFICGVWLFRRFFMMTNWRFTCCWTSMLQQIETVFNVCIIYNVAGIAQSGTFYCFGDCMIQIVQGIAQVLSSLATIEIARPGLEATTYETLVCIHNCAISFNTNIVNMFLPLFDLNAITHESYHQADPVAKNEFNADMRNATLIGAAMQLTGTIVFMWLLPANKDMCCIWKEDPRFHNVCIAGICLTIAVGMFCCSTSLSLFTLFPATQCLKIAGGDGC
mmetsp:Transcript_95127/g.168048  ORF Transcript_95127/g.168048 Transcript_95127/m.168048 type:complete len:590 (+) Transcript_95127:35-1804(+)